jgi:protein TonB
MKSGAGRVFQTNGYTMDINNLLRADYLDIIFEGRNKMYGGYELRRKYARRSRRASAIVVASALLLSTVPTLASMFEGKATVPKLTERILDLTPPPVMPDKVQAPPPPPPPRAPAFDPPPSIAAAVPRIVPNEEVERPPATVDEMRNNTVSLTTEAGKGDPGLITGPGESVGAPGGTGVEPTVSMSVAPLTVVDQPPVPNFDLSSWLASHLRYPEAAREQGQEGRSIIEFIVNEDGSIEGTRVVRGSYALLDAEALRVVQSMPKWKAGRQGGKPVRVFFNLPIQFTLD